MFCGIFLLWYYYKKSQVDFHRNEALFFSVKSQ
jgi:hypothetical protein